MATGSPLAASADYAAADAPVNTDPVRTNLLEVDEAGKETVVGAIVLDPNDEVDVDFVEGPNGEVVLDLDVLAGSVTVTVGGQTVELTAGQPVPPLPVGAREALRGVMNALIALRSGVVDKKDETRIEAAIGDVTKALDQPLWVDVLRVQPKDGHRVFEGNEGRGYQTARAAQGQEKRASGRNLTGTARRPARRGRMLASVAIDDAVSAGVDPTRIDKAAKERQAGDRDAADMKVESAIERYRNAWQHVVR